MGEVMTQKALKVSAPDTRTCCRVAKTYAELALADPLASGMRAMMLCSLSDYLSKCKVTNRRSILRAYETFLDTLEVAK
jgi:hypothetical protein